MALTGEITLNGRILPVSGIREKLLAAQRAGVKTVVFPAGNEVDVNSLPMEGREGLKVVLAESVAEVTTSCCCKSELTSVNTHSTQVLHGASSVSYFRQPL